jgi:hypothetical protein
MTQCREPSPDRPENERPAHKSNAGTDSDRGLAISETNETSQVTGEREGSKKEIARK